jgi:hypothetical protein
VLAVGTALTLGLLAMVPATAVAAAPTAPAAIAPAVVAPATTVPADTAPADTAASAPTLRLESLSPAVAHPGDVLQLTVQIDNPTDTAITDARLALGAGWKALTTRSPLDDWVSGVGSRPTNQVATDVPEVAPGASTVVSLELAVDRLSINGNQRAPRSLAVTLRHGRDIEAELRSFLLWDPSTESGVTPDDDVVLSILAPVTGPTVDQAGPDTAEDSGTADTDWMADATAPGGRLARVLAMVDVAGRSTGTKGALSLALDPALVATGLTSPDTRVSSWAHAASLLGDTTDVRSLPPDDPDLAALAHAGLGQEALRDSVTAALPGGWEVPATWGNPIAWPADAQAPDLATLAAGRDAGLGTAVLPSGLTPVRGTDTGLADVETPSGLVRALIADPTISRALTDATTTMSTAPTSTPLASTPQLSPALAVQRLLAETAVVSAQSAGSEPHLLAVLPRDWTPDLDATNAALRALSTSGWVRVAPVSELLSATASDVQRRPLADSTPQAGELGPDDVRRLAAARTALREFASITADPDSLTAPLTTALAAPVSVAGRSQTPEARSAAVSAAVEAVHSLQDNLSVAATDATLISARGDLPVVVSNGLDVDVTVQVTLRPGTPRLVVEPTPLTTVPARSQSRVIVPVQALSSGDVDVTVEVLTASGTPVAAPITLQLAVRAGWETVGTAVAAGIVALLLIVGIVRTIRRGRSPRRAVDVDVPDPLLPGRAP